MCAWMFVKAKRDKEREREGRKRERVKQRGREKDTERGRQPDRQTEDQTKEVDSDIKRGREIDIYSNPQEINRIVCSIMGHMEMKIPQVHASVKIQIDGSRATFPLFSFHGVINNLSSRGSAWVAHIRIQMRNPN